MKYTNPMKNGIRMIYGMMIMLTLLILVSIVIDAKATPEKRDPVMQSPANPNPPTAVDAGNSNEESGESGVGSVGEGKVVQVPREKRHEAPRKMIAKADAYLKALLGEKYVAQYIAYDESYRELVYSSLPDNLNPPLPGDSKETSVGAVGDLVDAREMTDAEKSKLEQEKKQGQSKPATTKGAEDIKGAPMIEGDVVPFQKFDVANSENLWVIVYTYNFKVQGPVDPMARIIRVYLDENGDIVRYEGPEEPYQFELGVDDVKKIASKAGMKTPNEAVIRPGGMGWLADDYLVLGDAKESIMWQVVSNSPEVGTPEIVYIHPDSGEVLGILTKRKEEYQLVGGIGAPLPEAGADSQQKTAPVTSRMNEEVKAKIAEFRARKAPEVDKKKMDLFIEKTQEQEGESKREGAMASLFSRIASFFAAIF